MVMGPSASEGPSWIQLCFLAGYLLASSAQTPDHSQKLPPCLFSSSYFLQQEHFKHKDILCSPKPTRLLQFLSFHCHRFPFAETSSIWVREQSLTFTTSIQIHLLILEKQYWHATQPQTKSWSCQDAARCCGKVRYCRSRSSFKKVPSETVFFFFPPLHERRTLQKKQYINVTFSLVRLFQYLYPLLKKLAIGSRHTGPDPKPFVINRSLFSTDFNGPWTKPKEDKISQQLEWHTFSGLKKKTIHSIYDVNLYSVVLFVGIFFSFFLK